MTTPTTPHYYIRLNHSLSAEAWFAVVKRMKLYMHHRGFEIDEFGDTDKADRKAVRRQGGSNSFEGQVIYPSDNTWTSHLLEFLDNEDLEISETVLGD